MKRRSGGSSASSASIHCSSRGDVVVAERRLLDARGDPVRADRRAPRRARTDRAGSDRASRRARRPRGCARGRGRATRSARRRRRTRPRAGRPSTRACRRTARSRRCRRSWCRSRGRISFSTVLAETGTGLVVRCPYYGTVPRRQKRLPLPTPPQRQWFRRRLLDLVPQARPRPALARDARSVPHPRVRDHAAADAGRSRAAEVPRVARSLSDVRGARRRAPKPTSSRPGTRSATTSARGGCRPSRARRSTQLRRRSCRTTRRRCDRSRASARTRPAR